MNSTVLTGFIQVLDNIYTFLNPHQVLMCESSSVFTVWMVPCPSTPLNCVMVLRTVKIDRTSAIRDATKKA